MVSEKLAVPYVPGLANVPATESSISHIDGEQGKLYYCGYPIDQLIGKVSFEEIVLLLMDGERPDAKRLEQLKAQLSKAWQDDFCLEGTMRSLPRTLHPMQCLQTCVSSLAGFYPSLVEQQDRQYNDEQKRQLITIILTTVATVIAYWERLSHGKPLIKADPKLGCSENFLRMVGVDPEPDMVDLFDVCLVLHAEHGINASTFTAIVSGSTLCDPFSAIASAVSALSGPLHGGANAAVVNMIDEIGSPNLAKSWIEGRLAKRQVIWGLGHREYSVKDPRATILEKMLDDLLKKPGIDLKSLETAKEVEQVCEQLLGEKGIYPNVDFYSGILYRAMGLNPTLFTPIFAFARLAGWLAHLMEQWEDNKIFRPSQIYSGYAPRAYGDRMLESKS